MLELLERMSAEKNGIITIANMLGDQEIRHQAWLLVDEGKAEWVAKYRLRITSPGYDALDAAKLPGASAMVVDPSEFGN